LTTPWGLLPLVLYLSYFMQCYSGCRSCTPLGRVGFLCVVLRLGFANDLGGELRDETYITTFVRIVKAEIDLFLRSGVCCYEIRN
jgi:hypothetical protein